MVFTGREAFFYMRKIANFYVNAFCGLLMLMFSAFTKKLCFDGWFYCKVSNSPPLSGETLFFFQLTPRRRPSKSLQGGHWNNLLVQNAVNNLNPNLTQSRSQKGSDAEKTFKAEGLLWQSFLLQNAPQIDQKSINKLSLMAVWFRLRLFINS